MKVLPRITLITSGDELLQGVHVNGHLQYIGEQLNKYGLGLRSSAVVRDDVRDICEAFQWAWEVSDIVIMTGGLGPTSDDCTREGVAQALGATLEYDPKIEAHVKERLGAIGLPLDDAHKALCLRLPEFEPLENPYGTAMGLFYAKDGKYAVLLPGPSQEMHPMFERFVLPRWERDGLCTGRSAYLQIRTAGMREADVSALLSPVFAKYPGLGVAYCAHVQSVDIRLSPGSSKLGWSQIDTIATECKGLLGEDFLCFGADSLEQVLINELHQIGGTLSMAESCTGGMMAQRLTDIPGASKVFMGGVISYSEDAKISLLNVPEVLIHQHGIVSAEVAVAMAVGAAEALGTDYALSSTGYAGPDGGTPDCPVGTVFVGYYSPKGIWSRKLVFSGAQRSVVRERASFAALDWMRRELSIEALS